ncbi:hypothetical protein Taro_026095 [Colocasia esculenta]|uniref:Phagocyte signaling-impaired protein n=1 Tax=Colocasia esculenta TaxID=4460 RepID=A0A843V5B3_COLES|nr:hypothetical protein [Colocasia esculenta]
MYVKYENRLRDSHGITWNSYLMLQGLLHTVSFLLEPDQFQPLLPGSGCSAGCPELRDTSLKMVDMYWKNLSFSKDLDPQENMHGEELLSMACNVLVQLFWRTKHLGYLLEAILILEFGLTIRRYGTLEIKNILLETVSHHILPQMLKSPLWSDLADLMREYLKFMDDYMREAADLTFVAYRHRNYSKAIEFVLFKERLQNSCQYLMIKVETSILQLKQKADNLEEIERTLENLNFGIELVQLSNEERYEALTLNEDLHSRPWWSPTPDINYLFGQLFFLLLCKNQAGAMQAIVSKAIKRRSFLPRIIYLSTQIAPSSFKENIEANGSVHDTKSVLELKSLLEQYSADLGYPFEEAIKVITGISEGQKSFKDFGSDVLCWMNFAVFFNAWNLCSHHSGEPARERSSQSTWNLVDRLIQRCIKEQLVSSQPPLTCPGSNFPVLVQLVTESCSWHILVIQSYLRSMLPSGKKKKKSVPADQLSAPLSHVIRSSIESLSSAVEEVKKWLDHQLTKSPDESMDVLLSLLQKTGGGEDPGHVFQMVEDFASVGNPELGERISLALQSWNSADVLRKFVKAQHTMLLKFHQMCESKLRLLESLKVSVQHV